MEQMRKPFENKNKNTLYVRFWWLDWHLGRNEIIEMATDNSTATTQSPSFLEQSL